MTGVERLRAIAGAWDEWDLGETLAEIADEVDRELCEALGGEGHGPAADVSMSAYDLLPEDERDAIAWVREHGGLDSVKKLLDWVVGHCSTKQQLDFDFWLSGRVMHELGFDEDMSDRDEVERRLLARLMPEGMEWLVDAWPRFEDNEPVRLLDDFERYGEENGVSAVTMYADTSFALNCRAYSKGERVNRPAPKVLDADGAEIELGDDLYGCESGRGPFRVSGVLSDSAEVKLMSYLDGSEFTTCAATFTHRAPVLAADGKPLREGETVWVTEDSPCDAPLDKGDEVTVRHAYPKIVRVEDETGESWIVHADHLTHERPDSWKRLEEDATRLSPYYYARDVIGLDTDKMPPKESRRIDMMRDLVRRAKALAERDAS